MSRSRDIFSILNINIRSFHKHSDELSYMLSALGDLPGCITLTESHLCEETVPTANLAGYLSFHNHRNRNGGGVSLFIKDTWAPSPLPKVTYMRPGIECIGASFLADDKEVTALSLYRPPLDSHIDEFFDLLENSIIPQLPKSHFIIISGDINIDLLRLRCDNRANRLYNLMVSEGFTPLVTKATRPNELNIQNSSLIDHVWVKTACSKTALFSHIILNQISDHLPCMVGLPLGIPHSKQKSVSQFRIHSEDNINKFVNLLQESNYNFIEDNTISVNKKFDIFINVLSQAYDKACPIQTKSTTRIINPWITKGLITSIVEKNKLYKSFRQGLIPKFVYVNYRNRTNDLIRKAKSDHFVNKFHSCTGNSKAQWGIINGLLDRKSRGATLPARLVTVDDCQVTDKQEIINTLNDFFASVGEKKAAQIPATSATFWDYLGTPTQDCLRFRHVSPMEVSKMIETLKNKASNVHTIPNKFYKAASMVISGKIAKLFNLSLDSGTFPDALKTARITPIFKKGNREIPGNYRPISILHTLAKLLEKFVSKQLVEHLNDSGIFYKGQFGFIKNSTTNDALTYLLENIYDNLNHKKNNLLIFIDLAKAFDTVSHNILLSKLGHYGARGVCNEWFKSYLSNRQQYIEADGITSQIKPVNCGVPQGSVLGPLLFLIFINDFYMCHNASCMQFADDTSILLSNRNYLQLGTTANDELQNIFTWLCANGLSVNLEKCSHLIISNKTIDKSLLIRINGVSLKRVRHEKLLGVWIDESLSFKEHTQSVSRRVARSLFALGKIRSLITKRMALELYYALIYPHFLYCINIWGGTHKYILHQLYILQKRAVRIIATPRHYLAHTDPIFNNLNLLRLDDIYFFSISSYMYRVFLRDVPAAVLEIFDKNTHNHNHNTRQSTRYYINRPQCTLSCTQKAFSYRGPTIYNALPEILKASVSLNSFKSKLRRYILNAHSDL